MGVIKVLDKGELEIIDKLGSDLQSLTLPEYPLGQERLNSIRKIEL